MLSGASATCNGLGSLSFLCEFELSDLNLNLVTVSLKCFNKEAFDEFESTSVKKSLVAFEDLTRL